MKIKPESKVLDKIKDIIGDMSLDIYGRIWF
jgi:hypothetical protein